MHFQSTFDCGDKAWCLIENCEVRLLTVGRISIEHIDSPGMGDTMFSNYSPQQGHKEFYMCVETGIGSGNVYTLGEHIFMREDEAREAAQKRIEAVG